MARIVIDCSDEYKKGVVNMAKDREMNTKAFIKFLIEKQKEEDRKHRG